MKKNVHSFYNAYSCPGFLKGRKKLFALFSLGVMAALQSIGQDYGDAPATYGYPSHKINSSIYLGSVAPDDDPFPYPGANADGDNLRKTNDENTFTSFPSLTVTTTTYTLSGIAVFNNTGSAAKITAWIDFDRDGIFQVDEGVQSASISSSATPGTTSLTWSNIGTTGPNITPGKTYIRLRITTDAAVTTATPGSAAANGEIEDYGMFINILPVTCTAPNNTIAQTSLQFQNPVLESGTALSVNAVYRFSNVTTGVDALVKITALVGSASITVFDDATNGVATAFQPNITYTTLPTTNAYAEFQISFVATATTAAYTQLSSLTVTGVDIDGDNTSTLREFQEFTNLSSYITNGATTLVAISNDGQFKKFQTSTAANAAGISLTSINNAASGVFKNVSSFTYRCGAANVATTSALPRLYSLYFECFAYTTPTIVTVNDQDFGDAPNTYSTLNASGGAKHTNTDNLKLGFEGADVEPDGFNDGTDNNGLAKDDDLQGVLIGGDELSTTFIHSLYVNSTSYSVGVTATNLTASAANLRAWIDFNRNGVFDIGEASSLVTVPASTENGLFVVSWPTLPVMTAGISYVRVRITTQSLNTNEPGGAKTDGEVEDYSITINAGNPPITIIGSVLNDVNGITDNLLNGTGTDAGGTLHAVLVQGGLVVATSPVQPNGIYIFGDIPTGSYTIQLSTSPGIIGLAAPAAALPAGWVNTSEAIDPSISDGTVDGIVAITAGTSDITNVNFGIEQLPTAGNGSNSATNLGGTVQMIVPAGTFTSVVASTDPSPGAVTAIRILSIPAGATTIVINGTTYGPGFTAFPGAGVLVPTDANGNPTQTITVDPTATGATTVTISFRAVDAAGKESTNTGSAVLNVAASVSISGSVWNDVSGNAVNDNGETIMADGVLFANLVDPVTNNVVQSVAVVSGVYTFSALAQNTSYKIILSTSSQTGNLNLTSSTIPAGFVNTGVNLSGTANTGSKTGNISITTSTINLSSQNFGIEKAPTATGSSTVAQANFAPYTQLVSATAFAGSDFDGGTVQSIRITAFPTNAQIIAINGTTYTSTSFATAFPNGATIPANTSGQPTQSLAVKPNPGVTSVTIPFVTIDNAGVASSGANVVVPYYTILPVTFGNVTAQVENCNVFISFETLTETNNKQFEVEYSTNVNSWKTLAVIPSNGNSTALQQYSYVHTKPVSEYNYYRIKQVDRNGNFIYSSTITIRSNCAGAGAIVSYPNPVQNELFVALPSGVTHATVKLLNAAGLPVATVTAINGGMVKMNTRLLSTGIYLLQVLQNNKAIYNQKIIKE